MLPLRTSGHQSLTKIIHYVSIIVSAVEFYEFCTPCRHFSAIIPKIAGKVLRSDVR